MSEQLRCLIELQLLESKKAALLKSREETPQRLAMLDREFSRFEADYLLKKAEYEHAQRLHRSLEHDINDLESKLARSLTRKDSVKNNREYQAILKEIDDIRSDISDKEDQVLELMESLDTLGEELKKLELEVEQRRQQIERDKERIQRESEQVADKIARVEKLQQEIKVKLEPDLLKRWAFLIERCDGIAVAPVEKGICQICHLNLPPQKFIELQRDEKIMVCPHCHRFIYWPGHDQYNFLEDDHNNL